VDRETDSVLVAVGVGAGVIVAVSLAETDIDNEEDMDFVGPDIDSVSLTDGEMDRVGVGGGVSDHVRDAEREAETDKEPVPFETLRVKLDDGVKVVLTDRDDDLLLMDVVKDELNDPVLVSWVLV
jgi:hypothetical protein